MDPKLADGLNVAFTALTNMVTAAHKGKTPDAQELAALAGQIADLAELASTGDMQPIMQASAQQLRHGAGVTKAHFDRVAAENRAWGFPSHDKIVERINKGERFGAPRAGAWPDDLSAEIAEREAAEKRKGAARRG